MTNFVSFYTNIPNMKKTSLIIPCAILVLLSIILVKCNSKTKNKKEDVIEESKLTKKEQLGKLLFFDENLSTPPGQSCSSCHDPKFGFADPDQELPVSQGVIPQDHFGNRKN